MSPSFAESTWFIVVFGIVQGASLPPVWRLIFRAMTKDVSAETQETRFIVMLLLSMVIIAAISGAVLLGPLYVLNLLPLRSPGSAWSLSWAGGLSGVFAAYYGLRKVRALKHRAERERAA